MSDGVHFWAYIIDWTFVVCATLWLVWFWGKRPWKNRRNPDASICESCGGEADCVDDNDVPLCSKCVAELNEAGRWNR